MTGQMLVFIGTYTDPILFGTGAILQGKGEGIYAFRMDMATGVLDPVALTRGVTNPSYLAFDAGGRYLYAVSELKTFEGRPGGAVSAFAVEAATGRLAFLNRQPTHGADPCHVVVDRERRHVFVANFMSGSVCVLPVRDDGSLDEASDFVQHLGSGVDPARQKGPHAHAVTLDPEERFAFVPDLGLDRLLAYRYDARRGLLDDHDLPALKVKPGAGPRHLAFHPGGRYAYLVNELDSTVAALTYDGAGRFEHLQTVRTLPDGFAGASTCADIQVSPSGTHVYASNRGHDSIVAFRVDAASGVLHCVGHAPTLGRTPRSFGLSPNGRWLLAANQDSDTVVSFRVDEATGALAPAGAVADVPTPVCVKFLATTAARAGG
jgi:6-phosphogluconolactonase